MAGKPTIRHSDLDARIVALDRLREVLRDDRERTRPRWAFGGVHPSGKLRAYYCWVPLCDMPRGGG